MTRISAVALSATLLVATATVAVAQDKGRADSRGRSEGARGGSRAGFQVARQAPMRALLRGLDLSEAQKDQVKAIHERYQPQYKVLRDSLRPAAERARAARQRGDTAAARAAWAETADERAQVVALAQREAGEIRAILSPDQQKVFDENLAAWRERGRDALRDHERGGKRKRPGRVGAGQ